jgi:hypothetical protein
VSVAAFIVCQRAGFGVPHAVSCRALGVSESWLYKWRDRPPTRRQVRRAELVDRIGKLFAESGNTYGSPRIWLDLRADGWRVSVNTVAKIMAEQGLRTQRQATRPVLHTIEACGLDWRVSGRRRDCGLPLPCRG